MLKIDWKKQRKVAKIFADRVSNEAVETKNAALIIAKFSRGETLTEAEEKELKEQFQDVLKIVGIGVPFALIPGASVFLPLIIYYTKKKGINLLPSSFESEKCYCGKPIDTTDPDCVEFKLCKDHSQDV